METEDKKEPMERRNKPSWTLTIGLFLILLSSMILLFTYFPLLKSEISYLLSSREKNVEVESGNVLLPQDIESGKKIIQPVDENFGIVIPKITANSKVVADVDPNDSAAYQKALTQGVAHAKGSAYPNENGNVFIFAHSGVDFFEAARYNAVFYLLNKMKKGDDIHIFYQGQKFHYTVNDKKVVYAEEIQYLESIDVKKTVTLMTCWPAGTTWKRLVVIGEQL